MDLEILPYIGIRLSDLHFVMMLSETERNAKNT
jgi:hypothetical protein